MKKIFLFSHFLGFMFCIATTHANAQLDVKIDPIDLILNSPKISGEYLINDEIGVELLMGFKYRRPIPKILDSEVRKGYSLRLIGKYYFSPKSKADRFYIGPYVGSKSLTIYQATLPDVTAGVVLGLTGGYKWVGKSGLLLEVAAGMGYFFSDDLMDDFFYIPIDVFARVAVGYRF